MRFLFFSIILSVWPAIACAAAPPGSPGDTALAAQYFRESKALWQRDGGKLWGRSLQSPLLFVEPGTRRVLASQADTDGKLHAEDGIYVGKLPGTIGIANYSVVWAGVHWTMVMWPLPKDRAERAVLMMHESWHRSQEQIGFPPSNPTNAHLDSLQGRFWLQLEWRALGRALEQPPKKRCGPIEDALLFRAYRRSLFPHAAEEERTLVMHEGLAEYTGVRLSGLSDAERTAYVRKKLQQRPATMPTFVRSFAYLSGPAYGLLLDAAAPGWTRKLTKKDDLGALLQAALRLKLPAITKADVNTRARRYDSATLRVAEQKRDEQTQKRLAHYRAQLIDGPRLALPLQKIQLSFDPRTLQPMAGVGTVYPTIRIIGAWGTLTVTDGALIDSAFHTAYVIAPVHARARPLKEKGWELHLNKGWTLAPGKRRGDYLVVKEAR